MPCNSLGANSIVDFFPRPAIACHASCVHSKYLPAMQSETALKLTVNDHKDRNKQKKKNVAKKCISFSSCTDTKDPPPPFCRVSLHGLHRQWCSINESTDQRTIHWRALFSAVLPSRKLTPFGNCRKRAGREITDDVDTQDPLSQLTPKYSPPRPALCFFRGITSWE